MPPSVWCERNLHVDYGPHRGPLRLDLTAHLREPLDMLADPNVRRITLKWPGQTSKSTFGVLALAYWHHEDPAGDAAWVMPNEKDAEEFGQDRVLSLWRASPAMQEILSNRKTDARADRLRTLTGMTTRLRGANSAAGLASWSYRRVVLDEVDKYRDFIGAESDPVSLATVRFKTYPDALMVMTSTPTLPDGHIAIAWEESDRREYFLACPKCGEYQTLVTPQVVWPKDATPDEVAQQGLARYRCASKSCEAELDETERVHMIDAGGLWVPHGCEVVDGAVVGGLDETPSHVGYHVGQLATRWTPLGDYAAEFMRSRKVRSKLQNFRNSWEGEVWEETVRTVKSGDLAELCLPYEPRTVPADAHFILAAADVQAREVYYVIRAFAPSRSYLVDEGFVLDLAQLERTIGARFPDARGRRWPVSALLIDSGFRTQEIYDWCRPAPGREFEAVPVKGRAHLSGERAYSWTKLDDSGLRLVSISTEQYADKFSNLIRGARDGNAGIYFHKSPSPEYLRELASEHKIEDRKTGKLRWSQKAAGLANHRLDCERYLLCLADMWGWWALEPGQEPPGPPSGEDEEDEPAPRADAEQIDDADDDAGGYGYDDFAEEWIEDAW